MLELHSKCYLSLHVCNILWVLPIFVGDTIWSSGIMTALFVTRKEKGPVSEAAVLQVTHSAKMRVIFAMDVKVKNMKC